jgi:hypothetical protein
MNTMPPDEDKSAELDALYGASGCRFQPARGGVRQAILANASRSARARSLQAAVGGSGVARQAWYRPSAFGALAAALLAVFMIAPRFLGPPLPPVAREVSAVPAAAPPVVANLDSTQMKSQPAPSFAEPAAKVSQMPQGALQRQLAVPPAQVTTAAEARSARQEAPARSVSPQAQTDANLGSPRSNAGGAASAAAPSPASADAIAPHANAAADAGAALRRAAESGDLSALRELLEKRSGVDARDAEGRTALMLATLHGHSQAVAVLLDYGADPNIADASGESPLDAALAADESEIIATLMRHGAR